MFDEGRPIKRLSNGNGRVAAREDIYRTLVDGADAVARLRESEQRYRTVISAMGEGVILWDRHGTALECNASAERILGVPRNAIVGQAYRDIGWQCFLEDGSEFPEESHPLNVTLQTGRACSGVVMGVCRPPGGLTWISMNSQPLFTEGGARTLQGVVTSFADITHRKGAEEQMSLLARHVRLLLESTDIGMFGIDLSGRCTFLNSFGARLLGHNQVDVVGKDLHTLVSHKWPDGCECVRHECRILQVLETGQGVRGSDHVFCRADGSCFPVEYSCHPIRDGDQITGAVITFSDISSRRQAEEALRQSQAQLAEAQRLAHVGSYQWTRNSERIICSEETIRILEQDPLDGVASADDCLAMLSPEDHLLAREVAREALAEGKPYSFECKLALPDGRTKHLHVVGKPELDEAGKVAGFTGALMDITERKQLEERLLRAQRLETAGRIAGQVAHDFNNLLSPLALYPDLLRMQLPDGHPGVKYCEGMLEVVQQMADINADLLTLGRRGHFEHQAVDMNRVVQQAMERLIGKPDSLLVTQKLAPSLPFVKGASAQLLRMVTNLIQNAREAMNDVGTLAVRTETVYVDEPFGHYDRVNVGEYARVTVSDTGHGIPRKIRDRIFDAFFTTKLADKKPGTGLGLSIVLAVVEDHAGYVDLQSEEGGGTTFSVYLPVCADRPKPLPQPVLVGGRESVLVVDDDRALREAVGELLRRLGYRVDVVWSGEAAVSFVMEHPVDLLILDMIMPSGIDGTETFRRIREFIPDQKAIVLSGFAESERVQEALRLGAGAFVRKPVTVEKLARVVREELDGV